MQTTKPSVGQFHNYTGNIRVGIAACNYQLANLQLLGNGQHKEFTLLTAIMALEQGRHCQFSSGPAEK